MPEWILRLMIDDLNKIMTTGEIEDEFFLAKGTVRHAILHDILAREEGRRLKKPVWYRKSGDNWLVHRKEVVRRWGQDQANDRIDLLCGTKQSLL